MNPRPPSLDHHHNSPPPAHNHSHTHPLTMASTTGDPALMEAIQLLGLDTPWTMAERGDLEDMQMAAAVDHTLDFDRPASFWRPRAEASAF
mmetsp:Transcript_907/g.1733  ORF Transcript_907/g.1733 Transcript_907/m.1733 type:complete len:91 (-) Transcript_907:148-420(-)